MLTTIIAAAVVGGLIASPFLLAKSLTAKVDKLIVQIEQAVGDDPANRILARQVRELKENNQEAKSALKKGRVVKALELSTEASLSATTIISYLGI